MTMAGICSSWPEPTENLLSEAGPRSVVTARPGGGAGDCVRGSLRNAQVPRVVRPWREPDAPSPGRRALGEPEDQFWTTAVLVGGRGPVRSGSCRSGPVDSLRYHRREEGEAFRPALPPAGARKREAERSAPCSDLHNRTSSTRSDSGNPRFPGNSTARPPRPCPRRSGGEMPRGSLGMEDGRGG